MTNTKTQLIHNGGSEKTQAAEARLASALDRQEMLVEEIRLSLGLMFAEERASLLYRAGVEARWVESQQP